MALSATFYPTKTATSDDIRQSLMPTPRGMAFRPTATLRSTPSRPDADAQRSEDARVIERYLLEYVQRRDRLGDGVSGSRADDIASLDTVKSRIAHHYSGLVEAIARRYQSSGEPYEDLVQEGSIGLLSALEKYDPAKGVKFSTYATHAVAGAIRHYLRDRGKIIREPAWVNEMNVRVRRATEGLTQRLGRAPHSAEIAQVLNLTEESVEELLTTRQVFQVAAFGSTTDDPSDVALGLVDPEKIRSETHGSRPLPLEDRIVLEEAARKLKRLEQTVLHAFFFQDRSQVDIAREVGFSCNYVSHVLKNATAKMRRVIVEAEVRDRCRTHESTIVDAASGLYTSKHLTSRIDEEISRAARVAQSVAILRIALKPNTPVKRGDSDSQWAAYGDAVRKSIRRMDLAARFDNDQIVVLLPKTGETCAVVAERLRGVLSELGEKNPARFSVQISSAVFPQNGRTAGELLGAAA